MTNKTFVTDHPKDCGCDVTVEYDNNYKFVRAVYLDSEEEIEMSDRILDNLQSDIDRYVKP